MTLLRVIAAPDEGSAAERYLDEVEQRLHGVGLVRRRQVEQGDLAQIGRVMRRSLLRGV